MERPVFITHQSRRKPDTKERGRERAFLRAACAAQSVSHHSAPLFIGSPLFSVETQMDDENCRTAAQNSPSPLPKGRGVARSLQIRGSTENIENLVFYGPLDGFGGIESSRLGVSIASGLAGDCRDGVLF